MGWRDIIIDAWSALSHKAPLREDTDARINGWAPPSWIPERDRRRLAAYTVLAAYDNNVARHFIQGPDEAAADSRREYGDAALIIDTTLANLLGGEQTIAVVGAGETTDGEGDTAEPVDAYADTCQDALDAWAEKEQLALKVQDCERKTVRDGDAVYLLGWDAVKKRPGLAVLDGGFYFPVLPDSLNASDYPETVHFAWELPGEDFPDNKTRLRRITYRLGPISSLPVYDPETGDPTGEWQLRDGDTLTETGDIVRTLPWATDPTATTCYLTDATWILDDVKGNGSKKPNINALDITQATIAYDADGELWERDLGFDFLPIVHVPNTPAGADHFGTSSLAKVLQLLDDLQAADTDSMAASATTGSPIVGISGSRVEDDGRSVGPGEVWGLGENGSMDVLDTSGQLREMREFVKDLQKRLSTNARLPGTLTGAVDQAEIHSDFSNLVSMAPLIAMIRAMRLTRSVKYPLLFKMVLRLMVLGGTLEAGDIPAVDLTLGSFLPQDAGKALEQVCKGLEAHAISLETGVRMLVEAGFPIEDAAEEVAKITSRMFEQANLLADATGDVDAVREFLGLDPIEAPPVSAPVPGAPTPPVVAPQPVVIPPAPTPA